MSSKRFKHPLCAYVSRGRVTAAQRRALEHSWPRWGLDVSAGFVDLDAVFTRWAPRVLEIGFGDGESLLAMAVAMPERDFIGVEIYPAGIGKLLLGIERERVGNLRIYRADASEVLRSCIGHGTLDAVQLFFPDPWPKKRHHKRRLVAGDFPRLVADRLSLGGHFHAATDCLHYAQQMCQILGESGAFVNLAPNGGFAPRPSWRRATRFERRAHAASETVYELLWQRV